MANRTDASVPLTSYEYYLDYIDLIPVDEKKLKASKRKSEHRRAARQRLGLRPRRGPLGFDSPLLAAAHTPGSDNMAGGSESGMGLKLYL